MNRPCPAEGCTNPQALRSDGVPLGWCATHRRERLRTLAVGTVRPGPRGHGWRVKTETGWIACTEDGRPLTTTPAQIDLAAIIERTGGLSVEASPCILKIDTGHPPAAARAARAGRLTVVQGSVVDALYCRAPQTDHALARELGLLVGTVGKRLGELGDGGLAEVVSRVSRRRLWQLTEAGRHEATARAAARGEAAP